MARFAFTRAATAAERAALAAKNAARKEQARKTVNDAVTAAVAALPKPKNGTEGRDGAPGVNGKDGADGHSPLFALAELEGRVLLELYGWTGGTGTPPDLVGYLGEFGIVRDAADAISLSGPKGADGTDGEDGKDGVAMLTGSRDPRPSDGKPGDWWLNSKSANLFQRDAKKWRLVINLRGPRGPAGSSGGTVISTCDKGSSIIVDHGPPPDGGIVGQQILCGSGDPS